MKEQKMYKLITFAPLSHAEAVRQAMGDAGAGKIGEYSHCTFSIRGVGRFVPLAGANPAIGSQGKLEAVEEERIEVLCESEAVARDVMKAVKAVHPYEEVPFDVYPIELFS